MSYISPYRFTQLEHWYKTPLGVLAAKAIKQHLSPYLAKARGQCLLQLGIAEQQAWLASSPVLNKYIVSLNSQHKNGLVQADFAALPFANDSIDVIILPHTIELVAKPTQLLAEVHRILKPGGFLFVIGFNAWSIFGLRRLLKLGKAVAPWSGHFFNMLKLEHLLANNQIDICTQESFFYYLPFNRLQWLQKTAFLEVIGELLWLYPGNILLTVAQKQVIELMPIKPIWQFGEYIVGKNGAQPSYPTLNKGC